MISFILTTAKTHNITD